MVKLNVMTSLNIVKVNAITSINIVKLNVMTPLQTITGVPLVVKWYQHSDNKGDNIQTTGEIITKQQTKWEWSAG